MRCEGYGVIFDMDGVLADTAEAHFASWQRLGERYGVEISRETFEQTFGRPNHQIIETMLGRELPEDELRQVDRLKEAAYRDIIRDRVEPVPGVVELIRELDEWGFRMAVGSSGPRQNIDLVLSTLGVERYFGAIVSGWDVERGKPDPDVFLKSAAGIGLPPRALPGDRGRAGRHPRRPRRRHAVRGPHRDAPGGGALGGGGGPPGPGRLRRGRRGGAARRGAHAALTGAAASRVLGLGS